MLGLDCILTLYNCVLYLLCLCEMRILYSPVKIRVCLGRFVIVF